MEGGQPHLGDLLTMVINHLLYGMILQVGEIHTVEPKKWEPNIMTAKVTETQCLEDEISPFLGNFGLFSGGVVALGRKTGHLLFTFLKKQWNSFQNTACHGSKSESNPVGMENLPPFSWKHLSDQSPACRISSNNIQALLVKFSGPRPLPHYK